MTLGRHTISLDRSVLNRYRRQRQTVAHRGTVGYLQRGVFSCDRHVDADEVPLHEASARHSGGAGMFGSTPTISRRAILKWGLGAAGTGLLAACGQQAPAAPPAAAKPTEA